MNAAARLALARTELDRGAADVAAARRLTLLVRQALEQAVHDLLATRLPGAERGSTSFQLIALRSVLPADEARRVAWTWDTLSLVCHHRGHAHVPRDTELRAWLAVAQDLTEVTAS